jgi:hypothetical protein
LWRYLVLHVMVSILLTGCGSTNKFEGRLDSVKDGFFFVNCSDEVNKGKRNIDAVGYVCKVELTKGTQFMNEDGMNLSMKDFPLESFVRVVLVHPENIKKIEKGKQLKLVAKEMILLND